MAIDEYDPTEFQKLVNDFLERRGITKSDLAVMIGVSQPTVNRWMRPAETFKKPAGLTQPRPPQLRKLAPVIGVPLHELNRMTAQGDEVGATQALPPQLAAMVADLITGWWETTEARREVNEDATRAIWRPHGRRRPNRRSPTPPPEDSPPWARRSKMVFSAS